MAPGNGIGTLGERSLHAGLKVLLSRPGDRIEEKVAGYVVDIVRPRETGPALLIEIQTGSFGSIRRKLSTLLDLGHPIRLVHPIAAVRWIRRLDQRGREISRRRSPKSGTVLDLFVELVSIPDLVGRSGLEIAAILVEDEEDRVEDGTGSRRRRGQRLADRRLRTIFSTTLLRGPEEFLSLLPPGLPPDFTTADLATATKRPRWLCQKFAYCLRKMGALEARVRRRAGWEYRRAA